MASPTFQRARSPEHKAQRREAILAAAARLAERDGVRQVTLADIADDVGIHKSALLRYFETREQIFLELTARAWREWAAAHQRGARPDRPRRRRRGRGRARRRIRRPATALRPDPAYGAQPRAPRLARGRPAYKHTSLGAVEAVATALEAPLPDLSADERRELVSAVALLAGAMYQIATPPPPLAQLYEAEPRLGHALLDLPGRLTRATRVLIAGLEAHVPD